MIKTTLQYLVSFGLIFLSLAIGQFIQSLLGISIPGSIIGMLILFALLATGIAPSAWVKPGATFSIRYMILLFVPTSVGLMEHFDLLLDNALPILASAIGGTFIVLVTLSLTLDRLLKKENK